MRRGNSRGRISSLYESITGGRIVVQFHSLAQQNNIKRGFAHVFLFLGFAASVLGATPVRATDTNPGPQIHWRSGEVAAVVKNASLIRETLVALEARAGERHLVVQFNAPVGPKLRAGLKSSGLHLLNYLGDNAFFAAVSPEGANLDAVSRAPTLIDVKRIEREWRLHPYLLAGNIPQWAVVSSADPSGKPGAIVVGAYVLFHPDVRLLPTGVNIVARHGAVVRSHLESVNGLVIELPLEHITSLADEDAVQWIEPPLPRMVELNDSNRIITEVEIRQAPPYGLDGAGVTVLVYDGGEALASHPDFGGRLTVRDSSGLSDHATHVSGTVGGSGADSSGQYRGMAPAVTIESYGFEYDGNDIFLYSNPGDIEDDYDEAINVYGADVSNNSIGTNTCWNFFPCNITGDYGVTSALIDSIVGGSLGAPFRVVWANGNERSCTYCPGEHQNGYHSTAPPACAKNHLTVGALNSNDDSQTDFTSWGPCDDGRLKPDVSAPGCQGNADGGVTSCSSSGGYTVKCGTSMAAPTVAGISALILQDYRALFPSEPDFTNATLRSILAHTAQDRGNPGPDYSYGYGSVRSQAAIDHLRTENFLEDEVAQGESYSILVFVGPGDQELKVTLAWDDPPGTPNVDPALVNDLDLVVYDPSSVQRYPWTLNPGNPAAAAVQTQADHLNMFDSGDHFAGPG
jgi:subtilisin family serine protease